LWRDIERGLPAVGVQLREAQPDALPRGRAIFFDELDLLPGADEQIVGRHTQTGYRQQN